MVFIKTRATFYYVMLSSRDELLLASWLIQMSPGLQYLGSRWDTLTRRGRDKWPPFCRRHFQMNFHYCDVIMGTVASQISSPTIVYSIDQRKHQSFASLAFVQGIHRWPVNSTHKGPVTRKIFPFDDVIMIEWKCLNFDWYISGGGGGSYPKSDLPQNNHILIWC